MIPDMLRRLQKVEGEAAPPTTGKHLVFKVEAPHKATTAGIVAFLKGRGHAIHEEDDVFVMNLGAYRLGEDDPIRDLSTDLLTEEARASAEAGGKWPKGLGSFTFRLDSPKDRSLH